jgi:hypothetical protein
MWVPQLESVEVVSEYEELGIDRMLVPMALMGEDPAEGLKRFGDEVMSSLKNSS